MLLISIYNNIYEISGYVKTHPGEGIKDVYLRHYKNKEATDEFERYHMTNESDEMLLNARKEGFDEETNIYFVCPFFFKNKKIPKYFKFFPEDKYAINYINKKDNNTFVLRRSNSDINSAVSLTFKNDEGEINHLKIRKLDDNTWFTFWEDDEGETIEINEKYIEDIIQKIMINNEYKY